MFAATHLDIENLAQTCPKPSTARLQIRPHPYMVFSVKGVKTERHGMIFVVVVADATTTTFVVAVVIVATAAASVLLMFLFLLLYKESCKWKEIFWARVACHVEHIFSISYKLFVCVCVCVYVCV
jgi:hypothetical protein